MNDTVRNGRLTEYIKEQVSEFIARESNHSSLVTVTRVRLANSLKKAEVLITVYPEEKEQEVLDFLKRRGSEIRNYVKNHIRTRTIPFLEFIVDGGAKNRQRIDELS